VPLILAGPGLAKGNCTRPVGLIDLYPTLSELCGLGAPLQTLEGHSLTPLLRKPSAAWPHPAITTFHRNDHTIRTERWRYIRYANGDEELYDSATDPHEWANLAAKPEHHETVAKLRRQLPKVNAADAPVRTSGR
jgi:arylsulfatase A-like enzyme